VPEDCHVPLGRTASERQSGFEVRSALAEYSLSRGRALGASDPRLGGLRRKGSFSGLWKTSRPRLRPLSRSDWRYDLRLSRNSRIIDKGRTDSTLTVIILLFKAEKAEPTGNMHTMECHDTSRAGERSLHLTFLCG